MSSWWSLASWQAHIQPKANFGWEFLTQKAKSGGKKTDQNHRHDKLCQLKGPSFGIIVAFLPTCPSHVQHTKTLTDQLGSSPSHRYRWLYFYGFYHRESTFFRQQVPHWWWRVELIFVPGDVKSFWVCFSGDISDIFDFLTIASHHEPPSFGNIFWFTCSNHLKQSKFYIVFFLNPPSTKPL